MKKAIFILILVLIVFSFLFYYQRITHNETKTCNGKEYDYNIYSCKNGELAGKCKGEDYYLDYQFCDENGNIKDKNISHPLLKCGGKEYNPASQLCDLRDGKIYKYVKIGEQIWMGENLNYETEGSACYGNDPANCDKYGRLYDTEAKNIVCPKDWHLSTCNEWLALLNNQEKSYSLNHNSSCTSTRSVKNAGIKAKNGWNNGGNGTDDYGFAALPGGYGNSDGSFGDVGNYGGWWDIETYTYTYDHFGWYIYYNSSEAYNGDPYGGNKYGGCLYFSGGKDCKMNLLSVRCVKNTPCGETTYDPSKEQKCCDNTIIYNGSSQFCVKGKVYDGCGEVGGGEIYDPETEFCYEDSKTGYYEVRKKIR